MTQATAISAWPIVSPNQNVDLRAGAVGLQRVENAGDLGFASLHPDFRFLPVQQPLIDKAHRLVAEPGRQRADF